MSVPFGESTPKLFRWSPRQLALIDAIYRLGDVWAIGAKRSGKSTAIVEAIRQCVYEWETDVNGIMAAPSYGQIERNFMESWRELVPAHLYREVHDSKNPHIECYVGNPNPQDKTVIIYLASGQYPKRIEGATVGWCAFTELQDGESFWNVVKARVSDQCAHKLRRFGDGLPDEGWLSRTLEGTDEAPYYRIAFTTYDNARNLHPDYIASMLKNMTPREAVKYLEGKFAGATDAIYPYFLRTVHASRPVSYMPGVKILIGLDFNLSQQSAVFCQWHQGTLYVFDELWLPGTVQDQAGRIKTKLFDYGIKDPKDIRSRVLLCPDASGRSGQHARGESSFAVLEQAGFVLHAGLANPEITDRDLSLNVLLENAKHEHRLFLDKRCIRTIESIANLRAKDRDKSEWSHLCDALGYVVWFIAPQHRQYTGSGLTREDLSRHASAPRGGR